MNSIRQIRELNKRELENGVSTEASWHADYRDTAYIYIGGLPFELSEGDIVTIFSQFGEPTYVKLVRDKETGKSRGFAFLKYEDQRSTDIAVDNLGGAIVMGRTLKVDHTRYKRRDDESDDGNDLKQAIHKTLSEEGESIDRAKRRDSSDGEARKILPEEQQLAKLIDEHDADDPMKPFLIEEMREKIAVALSQLEEKEKRRKTNRHDHHRHRSRREPERESSDGKRRSHHRSIRDSRKREYSSGGEGDDKHDLHQRRDHEESRHRFERRARDRSNSVDSERRVPDEVAENRRRRHS